jgi:hypothetical protein
MRGWLLVRAVVAVLAVSAGWLLGVLPVLPIDWQPRAPIVALLIVFILYVTAEYSHGIAGRKETEAYRSHVRDLQAFANQAAVLIGRRQLGIAFPVDMASSIAKAFRKHFPDVASLIDEWNEATDGYQAKASAFLEAANAEHGRLKLGGTTGWNSVLQGIVNKQFESMDLLWSVENDYIVITRNGMFSIAPVPATAAVTERLLLDLWDSCNEIVGNHAAVQWVDVNRIANRLWRPLVAELEPIGFKHDLGGECKLCPK